ncbi:hypothetical protein [Methylomonas sp.]|jgi:hypothetical protein|uniref:hypothetical protein n=1 Tax=Methylomonas sp. TaxID=418 RepID=UPI0025FDBE3C|nr:hypothetical protein [Methylomonas sp.]
MPDFPVVICHPPTKVRIDFIFRGVIVIFQINPYPRRNGSGIEMTFSTQSGHILPKPEKWHINVRQQVAACIVFFAE